MKRTLLLLTLLLVPMASLAQAPSNPLLQSANLVYQGAFRVPRGMADTATFAYGGTAIVYNAANDSLFMVGHDHHQRIAEISIPAATLGIELAALKTATMLQGFADPSQGRIGSVGRTPKVGGLLVAPGLLYGSAYVFYDAEGSQSASHWVGTTTLAAFNAKGPYKVGSLKTGYTSGYMTHVPAEWQAALGGPALAGNCCIPIISRTSFGPAAFVFNPADLGVRNPAPATPLVYYTETRPLAPVATTNPLYNLATQIKGLVFPAGTNSVLFVGTHGSGRYCYGDAAACGDPNYSSKGEHSTQYRAQVWAYDARDLLSVKKGTKSPSGVKPYATWELVMPFGDGKRLVQGTAYDPATQRLFVSVAYADEEYPVVHVFKVAEF